MAATRFLKLGDYLVHLDSIAYVSFSTFSSGEVYKAVIYFRATEGTIESSDVSYLGMEKLTFNDKEAQSIHEFFIKDKSTCVLF